MIHLLEALSILLLCLIHIHMFRVLKSCGFLGRGLSFPSFLQNIFRSPGQNFVIERGQCQSLALICGRFLKKGCNFTKYLKVYASFSLQLMGKMSERRSNGHSYIRFEKADDKQALLPI